MEDAFRSNEKHKPVPYISARAGSVPDTHATKQPPPPTRRALLRGTESDRAIEIARRIVIAALEFLDAAAPERPGSLSAYAGVLVVATALARADVALPITLREIVRRALVFSSDQLGLYEGVAGLLVALDVLDPDRTSFQAPRARLCAVLTASIVRAAPADLTQPRGYDLIEGVAGRVIALRGFGDEALPSFRRYAEALASEAELGLAEPHSSRPLNLGVAHGIAGLLAALNITYPCQPRLARRFVDILMRSAERVNEAFRWDACWRPGERPTARLAWCYQSVGIAAVIYDRATLERDCSLKQDAVAALDGVLNEPYDTAMPWDNGLCHGRSGVAAIVWRFAKESPSFQDCAALLAQEILADYDGSRPYGYAAYNRLTGRTEDRHDWLDGGLGIALFLVDAATANARPWLPLFGLLPD